MKKTTLALSALALSLGLALSPLSATAAETSSATTAQQMPSPCTDARKGDAFSGQH
ncbi:serine endoprotease [Escherichia coli]|uniref:Serine endoprotease n=1 Tax=Escherichia coli TaxID=562 RepID=A0A376MR26_ECOLX|nr:serine endoprotease [Escherichia coli]